MHLSRYMHANPVKDRLVDGPEDWPYSNYLEWINRRSGTRVDREFIKENFQSAERYAAFVADYVQTRTLPDELTSYLVDWGVE